MLAGLYLKQNTLILELEGCNKCFQPHCKVKKRNFLKQLTNISFRNGFLAAGIISNKKIFGYYGIYTVFYNSYSFVPFSL